jgi:hypothetical protein
MIASASSGSIELADAILEGLATIRREPCWQFGKRKRSNGCDPLSRGCAFVRRWAAPLRQVIIKVQVELLSVVGVERIKLATSSGSSI